MTPDEIAAILAAHKRWRNNEPDGKRANLYGANLYGANLARANLDGIMVNWNSHALLSELLWRSADTTERQMLAAFVGRRRDWCWNQWLAWNHPERDWALAELRRWVKPDDGAPKALQAAEPHEEGRC